MNIEKSQIVTWITLAIITIGLYYWISFYFNLNIIQYWIIGIVLSFMIVFILRKIKKLWKIPIFIMGLDLIYHLCSAIRLYSLLNPPESIFHTPFLSALQSTYAGDSRIVFILFEIPFVMLTTFITIGFYLFYKVKNEIV